MGYDLDNGVAREQKLFQHKIREVAAGVAAVALVATEVFDISTPLVVRLGLLGVVVQGLLPVVDRWDEFGAYDDRWHVDSDKPSPFIVQAEVIGDNQPIV